VRRDPHQLGVDRARWTLRDLLTVCDWLRLTTEGGLSHLLDRLGIHYKRGRDYGHTPDPDYEPKRRDVASLVAEARASQGRTVALFEDEVTYYRQPTVARAYDASGADQPLAHRSHQANTATRIAGVLNPLDGQVLYRQASHLGIGEWVRFHQQICQTYREAVRIYVIQDNWPIHFHPDVLVALEEQESPWPIYRPKNWPEEPSAKAKKQWGGLQLPIQLVPLPTYASWTNPIEKLWRWLRQEGLHLHRLADRLEELRAEVRRFLDRFALGSLELLRYVGLPVPV
jgi:transposase